MLNSDAPGPLEFYKNRFDIENNLTRNILKAIPPDELDYRPHERSPSTGQIVWTITRGLHVRVDMITHGASDVIRDPHPALAEMSERFEDTLPDLALAPLREELVTSKGGVGVIHAGIITRLY